MRLPKKLRGFTLIELLIVISIIAILMAVATVSYTEVQKRARNQKRQTDLALIATALQRYYSDHGTYPNTNYNGQFETAGRSCQTDKVCCLLGGVPAQTVTVPSPTDWKCTTPFNEYIKPGGILGSIGSDHTYSGIPKDPLINAGDYATSTVTGNSYAYASTGQSYVLVTQCYEGTAPAKNLFSSSHPYYARAVVWTGGSANTHCPNTSQWANQYVVSSQTN